MIMNIYIERETAEMQQVHKWPFRITTNNKCFFSSARSSLTLRLSTRRKGKTERERETARKDNWTVSFSRSRERERENGQLDRAERECMCIQSMKRQKGYVHQRAGRGISSLPHLHNPISNAFVTPSTVLLESDDVQVKIPFLFN